MAFLPQDLYLASGTSQLLNNWVDTVYKFDSSSFYNWEQDNLPLYDLEDRDDYLYEMNGYPSSSVDGFMLTVSDCGIDNKKVFGTISDAVDALPKKIRFPVIIEVATSGPLGGLHLESRDFEGSSAGIEVINRGFAKVLCGSTVVPSSTIETLDGNSSAIATFSSVDTSNTMTESSSLGVSETVWVGNTAGAKSWWNYYTRTFIQTPEWSKAADASERTVSISSKFTDANTLFASVGLLTDTASTFRVTSYSDNSASSDIWISNKANDSTVQRKNIEAADTARSPGFVYANALSGVTVKDCTGKIYIRGFCVDGASKADITADGTQNTYTGFDVQNSEVVIENCTTTRCKNAGLQAVNSNVILNRGFIAFHNYELSSVGEGYLNQKNGDNPTPGLRAINSNITLSASIQENRGLPIDSPFSFYRNMVGIELQNSQLVTPPNCKGGVAGCTNVAGVNSDNPYGSQTIVLQSFYNVNEGILAKDSLIETGYRIASFQNKVGIKLDNSTYKVAQVSVDHNQEGGIVANESIVNYNKNGSLIGHVDGPFFPVTQFTNNGQHVLLNSSEFIPTYAPSAMATNYGVLSFSGNHGVAQRTEGSKQTLPAVVVDNGSYMQAVCAKAEVLTAAADAATYKADGAIKGSIFRVVNQSNLDLFGHGTVVTNIVGPYLWSKQQKTAGLFAGNNSHIYVAGPTTICQFGVDALAEDNSTVEFGPHHKNGIIDASGWSLGNTPANQTQVRLHSSRACLVANRNSTINMHDMGDYHARWASKYITNPDYPTGTEAYNTSAYCSSGYMQFYPNPFINYTSNPTLLPATNYPTRIKNITSPLVNSLVPLPWTDVITAESSVSSLSYGGLCVRAVGGSHIKAQNVWFPVGWQNPSGAYYDISTAGNCEYLRIWNIADNSELHASYLSVGNTEATPAVGEAHPQDVSGYYYGPSAVWSSGTTTANVATLSGAPSSTPNTSGLSILDSFGLGFETSGGNGYYGKVSPENIGPFRLYVSPHPKAKFLGYPNSTEQGFYMPALPGQTPTSLGFEFPNDATLYKGVPYQVFAQGYATSGDCSAINNQGANYTNPSSIYPDLGASGYILGLPTDQQGTNDASSFYYTSAMLPYDTENRIWLDESAMNTFANAKNGTLGTSGRKKICGYYKSTTDYPGEAFWDADSGYGKGLGSVNLFDLDRDL